MTLTNDEAKQDDVEGGGAGGRRKAERIQEGTRCKVFSKEGSEQNWNTQYFGYLSLHIGQGWREKWSSNGMPSMIKLKAIQGKSDVWKFIRALEVPISKVVQSNRRKPQSLQFQFGTDKTKIFTHMCTICLQDIIMLGEDKHNESWEKALKKCTTPSNGLKHLVTAPPTQWLYQGTTE